MEACTERYCASKPCCSRETANDLTQQTCVSFPEDTRGFLFGPATKRSWGCTLRIDCPYLGVTTTVKIKRVLNRQKFAFLSLSLFVCVCVCARACVYLCMFVRKHISVVIVCT